MFELGSWVYLSVKQKMSALQRFLIVHSILYYYFNESVISDKKYDKYSRLLVELKKQNKSEYKETDYYYCMKDFDGSTGFDLYDRLNNHDREYLTKIANSVLKNYKGGAENV